MKEKLHWVIFWVLVGIFVVIVSVLFVPAFRESLVNFLFVIISGILFFLLGAALIFLTVKGKVRGTLKKFLILTGASSAGLSVSSFLHNIIYGLFIQLFGADFWDRIGLGDEPFFFVMAVIVCPIAFLVGAVGSVVLAIKK